MKIICRAAIFVSCTPIERRAAAITSKVIVESNMEPCGSVTADPGLLRRISTFAQDCWWNVNKNSTLLGNRQSLMTSLRIRLGCGGTSISRMDQMARCSLVWKCWVSLSLKTNGFNALRTRLSIGRRPMTTRMSTRISKNLRKKSQSSSIRNKMMDSLRTKRLCCKDGVILENRRREFSVCCARGWPRSLLSCQKILILRTQNQSTWNWWAPVRYWRWLWTWIRILTSASRRTTPSTAITLTATRSGPGNSICMGLFTSMHQTAQQRKAQVIEIEVNFQFVFKDVSY